MRQKVQNRRKSRTITFVWLFFELFMMMKQLVNALMPTQFGRLLQDFAFGGAGGEIPPESSSCASRPGGEEKQLVNLKEAF
ncbi:hypothetical protein B1B05_00935 [Domibacillus enclensis]|uniref:Secreted protein n=1 Tax=Domibacillus enclensis TaxID=1017273 RepID=A0ABX4EDM8_9BACI|nr:hypothetical protein B1B05_00935 [Domibacillus enclensis]